MSPEEKAKWLIEEMKGGCCRCPQDSKEAALTCCQEILSVLDKFKWSNNAVEEAQYWEHVKYLLSKS